MDVAIIIYIDINLQTLYIQQIKIIIVKYNTLFSDIQIDVHLNHLNFISIIIFIFSICNIITR